MLNDEVSGRSENNAYLEQMFYICHSPEQGTLNTVQHTWMALYMFPHGMLTYLLAEFRQINSYASLPQTFPGVHSSWPAPTPLQSA